MGLFTKMQENMADSTYENMKKYLKEKDGKIHIIMINSFSKWINQNFECENKYTTQLDSILSAMQNDGYEIVDIKFNSIQNQGVSGQAEGFHTLIMYR